MLIGNDSITSIIEHLKPTLCKLNVDETFVDGAKLSELKVMPRLKTLNVYFRKGSNDRKRKEEIQNLRQHLPHLTIRTFYEGCFYSLENRAYLWGIQQLQGPQF